VAEHVGARYSVALGAAAAFGAGLWGLAVLRRTAAVAGGAPAGSEPTEPAEPAVA